MPRLLSASQGSGHSQGESLRPSSICSGPQSLVTALALPLVLLVGPAVPALPNVDLLGIVLALLLVLKARGGGWHLPVRDSLLLPEVTKEKP